MNSVARRAFTEIKKYRHAFYELGLLQVVGTAKTVLNYLRAGVAHVMDFLRD